MAGAVALVRHNLKSGPAVAIATGLFAAVVLAESGGESLGLTLVFVIVVVAPIMFVFLRFGLLSLAATLVTLQAINSVPLTADMLRPHAVVSVWTVLGFCALAAYAFYVSRAGRGLLRGLT